ncbi:MAG: hypothetical protein ACRESK_09105, partial [Gammaproteobacteria bacterium]
MTATGSPRSPCSRARLVFPRDYRPDLPKDAGLQIGNQVHDFQSFLDRAPGILHNDVLPKARKKPDYIRDQGFDVLDRNNQRIDPGSLDWSSYSGRNFPNMVRQPPGENNALGRIKFVFPNSHFVYLHD